MNDSKITIADLKSLVAKFRDDRNWGKHHSSRSLATSIVLEAAELLEHFQWGDWEIGNEKDKHQEVRNELADVIIYCLFLADEMDIDISKSVKEKLNKAGKKYPAQIFKNHALGAEEYLKVKKKHRGQ
jgi:NTP pyrophosphatase (non-canonical NTP hydrolase)